MWKAIVFTIAMILALIVVGLVVYTLYAGSSSGLCNGQACTDTQDCVMCGGQQSCQTKCQPGTNWDQDSCSCIEPTQTNWKCETSDTLPMCISESCDTKDASCYGGITNCSSGCYYGSVQGDYAVYYLYDPDTGKADMVIYDFSSIPNGLTSPYTDTTHSAMILCDGSSPTISPDFRGVSGAFTAMSSSLPSCGDICSDSSVNTGLTSSKYNYYFQNYSSREIVTDFYAKDNSSNRIQVTLDGTQSCGQTRCLGKNTGSTDFKAQYVTVAGKKLYFASSTKRLTSPGTDDRKHMKAGHIWVFIDISCVNLGL